MGLPSPTTYKQTYTHNHTAHYYFLHRWMCLTCYELKIFITRNVVAIIYMAWQRCKRTHSLFCWLAYCVHCYHKSVYTSTFLSHFRWLLGFIIQLEQMWIEPLALVYSQVSSYLWWRGGTGYCSRTSWCLVFSLRVNQTSEGTSQNEVWADFWSINQNLQ